MKQYYVYIMAGKSAVLYTGVTNNLERRVLEHKRKLIPGFTSQYNIDRLAYYETWGDVRGAIAREKQIKGWLRKKKVALIESKNPAWEDLSAEWYGKSEMRGENPNTVILSEAKNPSSSSPARNKRDSSLRSE
jgi:putative endonuclease